VADDHAIAALEPPAARSGFNNLTGRLVSGDNVLIALRPFAEVLVVNAANFRAANRRGLHFEKHLAVAWRRHRHGA
jgi:hypothetical protein